MKDADPDPEGKEHLRFITVHQEEKLQNFSSLSCLDALRQTSWIRIIMKAIADPDPQYTGNA